MADPKTTQLITNVTDAPGKTPVQFDLYTATLAPGESVRVPIQLLDEKLRRSERAGIIHIGEPLPLWYQSAKSGPKMEKQAAIEREAKKQPPPQAAPPAKPPKAEKFREKAESKTPDAPSVE